MKKNKFILRLLLFTLPTIILLIGPAGMGLLNVTDFVNGICLGLLTVGNIWWIAEWFQESGT